MAIETTQLKFAESEETGELIGFVSRRSKTQKLMGVYEDSPFGKKICVLAKELKNALVPIVKNKLYIVEMKPMHSGRGYVVVSAKEKLFPAQIETFVVPKSIYKVTVKFGNKTVYFDPKDGNSSSSRTLRGVIKLLRERKDILDVELVIVDFTKQAVMLVRRMEDDGYIFPESILK